MQGMAVAAASPDEVLTVGEVLPAEEWLALLRTDMAVEEAVD